MTSLIFSKDNPAIEELIAEFLTHCEESGTLRKSCRFKYSDAIYMPFHSNRGKNARRVGKFLESYFGIRYDLCYENAITSINTPPPENFYLIIFCTKQQLEKTLALTKKM